MRYYIYMCTGQESDAVVWGIICSPGPARTTPEASSCHSAAWRTCACMSARAPVPPGQLEWRSTLSVFDTKPPSPTQPGSPSLVSLSPPRFIDRLDHGGHAGVNTLASPSLTQTSQFRTQTLLLSCSFTGLATAGTLACGNAVYLYLPVGFIQMLKAFTPTVSNPTAIVAVTPPALLSR